MKSFTVQSSFNNGVLDDRMAARLDIKQYYQGMSQGDNVVCLPQGGVRRRPGLKYIATPTNNGRLVPFVFNTDQRYLLAFSNLKIDIYRADTDALVDTVVTPYTTAQLFDLDYAQTADTMIIVHEDHQPRKLVRGATDADFTLSTISMVYTPQYDYNDASSPTPTSEIQRVYIAGFDDGSYKLTLNGIDTEDIPYAGSDDAAEKASTETEMALALQNLIHTGNTGISVAWVSGVTTASYWDVTFAGEAADAWRLMTGRYVSGRATGDERVSVTSRIQTGVPRKENVWSAGRGWPRTATFFEGRLWFGGSKSRPHTIWGSRVNNFFNFDPGKSRADQAVTITLDTDQINRIQALVGGRSLSVFTIGGEHVFKQSVSEPITPENVAIIPQTSYGSKKINPVAIGGAWMFVQRTGKALREFIYDQDVEAYSAASLTLLSPEIINDPIDMQVQNGTTADDATYVYITNSDGTLAVFNSARSENVAAWSRWTTQGNFKSAAVVLNTLYVLVERVIDGVTKYYIEKADPSFYTDSGKYYPSGGTSLTGLNHLDGMAVRLVADGYRVLADQTVPSATPWTLTLPFSVASVEVGLDFDVTVTTMPVVQDQGAGFDLRDKKRVSRVTLELYEALGVLVNGYPLPDTRNADGSYTPFTGRKSITLTGWDARPQITITQTNPLPATITGINMEVNG